MRDTLIQVSYLIASVLFILGLRSLTRPDRARRGMQMAAFGMLFAIAGTLLNHTIVDYRWIVAGLVIGVVIGYPMGMWVPMTAMPHRRIALSLTFSAPRGHACRRRGVLHEITSGGVPDAQQDGGARLRDHARPDHRGRNDHRRGQATGMDHVRR
jgi:NAD(P) transhydrogenase subunit beta